MPPSSYPRFQAFCLISHSDGHSLLSCLLGSSTRSFAGHVLAAWAVHNLLDVVTGTSLVLRGCSLGAQEVVGLPRCVCHRTWVFGRTILVRVDDCRSVIMRAATLA